MIQVQRQSVCHKSRKISSLEGLNKIEKKKEKKKNKENEITECRRAILWTRLYYHRTLAAL